MKHLTDEHIQAYLDGHLSDIVKHEVDIHLQDCSECHLKAKQYQSLYSGLNIEPELVLHDNFGRMVMSRISQEETTEAESKFDISSVLGFAAVILSLIGMVIFVDLDKLFGFSEGIFSSQGFGQTVIALFDKLAVLIPFNISAILMVVLILGVLGMADYFIRHWRHKVASFLV